MHNNKLLRESLRPCEGGKPDGAPAVRSDPRPVGGHLPHRVQQPDLLHSPGHHCGELCEDIADINQVYMTWNAAGMLIKTEVLSTYSFQEEQCKF